MGTCQKLWKPNVHTQDGATNPLWAKPNETCPYTESTGRICHHNKTFEQAEAICSAAGSDGVPPPRSDWKSQSKRWLLSGVRAAFLGGPGLLASPTLTALRPYPAVCLASLPVTPAACCPAAHQPRRSPP